LPAIGYTCEKRPPQARDMLGRRLPEACYRHGDCLPGVCCTCESCMPDATNCMPGGNCTHESCSPGTKLQQQGYRNSSVRRCLNEAERSCSVETVRFLVWIRKECAAIVSAREPRIRSAPWLCFAECSASSYPIVLPEWMSPWQGDFPGYSRLPWSVVASPRCGRLALLSYFRVDSLLPDWNALLTEFARLNLLVVFAAFESRAHLFSRSLRNAFLPGCFASSPPGMEVTEFADS